MGKRGRKIDPFRDQRMVQLFKQGLTLQEIGDEYGITRERVRQIIERNKVTATDGGSYVRSRRKCGVIYCEEHQTSKGYCPSHYASLKRYGDPTYSDRHRANGCLVPDCDNKHQAKGFCHKHYHNYKYYIRIEKVGNVEEYVQLKTSS